MKPRQHIKKHRHYFASKDPYSQRYGFSSSHVWMWELDYNKSWALKNLCFWTVVLEKTLESPLDCKEIQLVHPKGNQFWIVIGGTDAEAENPILRPLDVKNLLIGKDPDAGKDWKQEEKRMTKDEMIGWYHRLDGHEFEETPGVGDGQGSLACCSPWGPKESDTTEWLNWTEGSTEYCSKIQLLALFSIMHYKQVMNFCRETKISTEWLGLLKILLKNEGKKSAIVFSIAQNEYSININ